MERDFRAELEERERAHFKKKLGGAGGTDAVGQLTAGDDDTCSSAGIAQGEIVTVNELELAAPEPIPELGAVESPADQIVIPDDDDDEIIASTPPEDSGPNPGASADIPLEGDEDHALSAGVIRDLGTPRERLSRRAPPR